MTWKNKLKGEKNPKIDQNIVARALDEEVIVAVFLLNISSVVMH